MATMTTSDQIDQIAPALAAAQRAMDSAVKDSANPFFRSKYADLASVKDAIREPFGKHGLSIVQFPTTEYLGTPEPYEWTAKSGETRYGMRVACVVSVVTRILHASGQWIQGDPVSTMLPTGDPQSVGSAITYLRRYALQSAAGVATDDDDAETAHRNGQPVKAMGPAKGLAKPAGFDDWLDDMISKADEGTAELERAWMSSAREYRRYLTITDPDAWTAIKVKAGGVKGAA
jgi:ERF superfamily